MALARVISENVRFREGFLGECGFRLVDKRQEVVPKYQWTSAYGRPDLVLEVRADDKVGAKAYIAKAGTIDSLKSYTYRSFVKRKVLTE